MTTIDTEAHMKIFENYRKEFGVSPSGLTNIYHLEYRLSLGIASIYKPEKCVETNDPRNEHYCDIFVEEHWNYAVELYFRLLKSTKYDLSCYNEMKDFIWEFGEELHSFTIMFARNIINEMLTKSAEEGELDLCHVESIEQFFRDVCGEIEERLGAEDSDFCES